MRISSLSLANGDPHTKTTTTPPITSWEFSHTLSLNSRDADAYNFPVEWLDILEEFNATRIVASVVRGTLPTGAVWGGEAEDAGDDESHSSSVGDIIDSPSGSLLEVTFATTNSLSGIILERAWLRIAPRIARACGGGTSGSSIVSPESPPGGVAPVSPGVPRDWYTVFQDRRAAAAAEGGNDAVLVRLALPRARVGGEALRAAVGTSACRAHAGLGAAIVPRVILGGDWMGVRWVAERVCKSTTCNLSLHVTIAALIPLTGTPPNRKTLGTAIAATDWGGVAGRCAVCAVASKSQVIAGETIVSLLDAPLIEAGYLASLAAAAAAAAVQRSPRTATLLLRRCITGSRSHTTAFLGGGTVFVTLRNICDSQTWEYENKGFATLFETLPWLLSRVSNSTLLLIDARGRMISNDTQEQRQRRQWMHVDETVVEESRSGAQRGPPTVTKLTIPLPAPGTDSLISWRFESSSGLAHAEESPPDAHHGIEIPSVRVRACLLVENNNHIINPCASTTTTTADTTVREWTLPCLTGGCTFEVPVTDFSMPYNVAVLVSTATAFSLGSFVNALARKKRK